MTFAEKLTGLRKTHGWSQEELAAQITVSRQAISKWELGEAVPDTENVVQISKLFEVSIDYLLNDEVALETEVPAVKKATQETKHKNRVRLLILLGVVVLIVVIALLTHNASTALIMMLVMGLPYLIVLLISELKRYFDKK